jgi:hypothetical protein
MFNWDKISYVGFSSYNVEFALPFFWTNTHLFPTIFIALLCLTRMQDFDIKILQSIDV